METAQFTLWGSQCQQMIAHCIATSGILTPYLEHGQILFKGSSTVSCLSKLVTGDTLRICGRWTKNGMKGALHKCKGAHFMLYRQGKAQKVDDCLEQTMKGLVRRHYLLPEQMPWMLLVTLRCSSEARVGAAMASACPIYTQRVSKH